jgi:hypothetical protein
MIGESHGHLYRSPPQFVANWDMADRKLNIIKTTPIAIAVCESCKAQFQSQQSIEEDAEREMKRAFDAHKCQPTAAS